MMFFIFSLTVFWHTRAMKKFTSSQQRKGELGETIACIYLAGKGFEVIERNYTRKCGEIDVIARKNGITYFVEVKSVSHGTGLVRPEDNMNIFKQRKMAKTIAVYLMSHSVAEWQCDLVCIYLNDRERKAEVRLISDIILEN
jgi:putative endonuclease